MYGSSLNVKSESTKDRNITLSTWSGGQIEHSATPCVTCIKLLGHTHHAIFVSVNVDSTGMKHIMLWGYTCIPQEGKVGFKEEVHSKMIQSQWLIAYLFKLSLHKVIFSKAWRKGRGAGVGVKGKIYMHKSDGLTKSLSHASPSELSFSICCDKGFKEENTMTRCKDVKNVIVHRLESREDGMREEKLEGEGGRVCSLMFDTCIMFLQQFNTHVIIFNVQVHSVCSQCYNTSIYILELQASLIYVLLVSQLLLRMTLWV